MKRSSVCKCLIGPPSFRSYVIIRFLNFVHALAGKNATFNTSHQWKRDRFCMPAVKIISMWDQVLGGVGMC
jgi:hypothetical protein